MENTGSKEEAKQNDVVIVNEEKSDTQPSGEIKDSSKLEQHKLGDVQLLKQKEQVAQERTEQATTENSKPSIETAAPEKSTSKPIPHRASANIPIGKKPATQKQLTSPPKHMTPKSTANLQSEFRQAGFEIDDGFDSDDNQTFSELRRDEASTTSLDDSLKGSESFVSLDNYKEVGSQKKSSRVGSAKERDRKHSQESETQLKEQRKSSQDYEARLKESSSVAAAAVQREEVIQKPIASLATEILQASETGNSSSTVEPSPLLTSNGDFDSTKDKGADSLVEGAAAKKSAILTDQRKPTVTTADDDSSEDDDDDGDDDVMIKGDDVAVYIRLCVHVFVQVWVGVLVCCLCIYQFVGVNTCVRVHVIYVYVGVMIMYVYI